MLSVFPDGSYKRGLDDFAGFPMAVMRISDGKCSNQRPLANWKTGVDGVVKINGETLTLNDNKLGDYSWSATRI